MLQNKYEENYTYMDMSREELVDYISLELSAGNGKVFLTGGAGTGKSTLVHDIIKNSNPILTSTTGVSAIHINGQTVHSFFKLGISSTIPELKSSDEEISKKFRMRSITRYLSKMIKAVLKADFIVIDEVSMLNTNIMDMLEYRLKQSGRPDMPILFVGDLLQLPPVEGNSIMDHPSFKQAKIFNLNTIYRTTNLDFVEFSNNIRLGDISPKTKDYLVSKKYDNQDLTGYVQIFPTSREVDSQNFEMLSKIDADPVIYTPDINKKGNKIYQRDIDTFMQNSKISASLELKVGAQIIITRNSVCDQYVNGDVAMVEELNSDNIVVKLDRDGTYRVLEYVEFENIEFKDVNGKLNKSVKYTVKALPVMLGWAITIHKSQGAGIDKLYIRTKNLFAQSQFYVAISRSSNPDNLIIDYEDTSGLNQLMDMIPYINYSSKEFYERLTSDEQYK